MKTLWEKLNKEIRLILICFFSASVELPEYQSERYRGLLVLKLHGFSLFAMSESLFCIFLLFLSSWPSLCSSKYSFLFQFFCFSFLCEVLGNLSIQKLLQSLKNELNSIKCQMLWFPMCLFIFRVGEVEDKKLFRSNDLRLIKAAPEHF